MEKNFTPLHFHTPLVEFDLYYIMETGTYKTLVCAPIDFEMEFKLLQGKFVKISDNPGFYDSLISGIEKAIMKKKHLLPGNRSVSIFRNFHLPVSLPVYTKRDEGTAAGMKKHAAFWFHSRALQKIFD